MLSSSSSSSSSSPSWNVSSRTLTWLSLASVATLVATFSYVKRKQSKHTSTHPHTFKSTPQYQTCPLTNVRATTWNVVRVVDDIAPTTSSSTSTVTIHLDRLYHELNQHVTLYSNPTDVNITDWTSTYHFHHSHTSSLAHRMAGPALTIQYIFVLDALNFCFWPTPGYEYGHLASALRDTLLSDIHAFDAERLAVVTDDMVNTWCQPTIPLRGEHTVRTVPIPLLSERARLLRELGSSLLTHWNGQAINVVKAAQHDASHLVSLITSSFPGFRDSCIYRGQQIFLYKRAQILVGDLYGAFKNQNYGYFKNIHQLTCFADYRVPQLLRQLGIISYSPELSALIDSRTELVPSEAEIEIRAATIQAVELMCSYLDSKLGVSMHSVQLDWILWERGEHHVEQMKPHHRTRTIFY